MKILVILAHPVNKSFNHAISKVVKNRLTANGHEVFFHDLYKERFDPILKINEIKKSSRSGPMIGKYKKELKAADGVIIIHPNWWGQPPAILKGWVDRVIRPGIGYRFKVGDKGEGVPEGLLKSKSVLIFNTTDTSYSREMKAFGDPLETLWKNCIFGFCGTKKFYRKSFGIIVTSALKRRKAWLKEAEEIVDKRFGKVALNQIL